jgi:hypothetical protein
MIKFNLSARLLALSRPAALGGDVWLFADGGLSTVGGVNVADGLDEGVGVVDVVPVDPLLTELLVSA